MPEGFDLLPPDEPDEFAVWALALGVGIYFLTQTIGPDNGNGDKYSLTITSQGPGMITVIIDDQGQGTVGQETRTFSKINYGASVTLSPRPDEGSILESITKKSFTIKSDTTINAYFKKAVTEKILTAYQKKSGESLNQE